MNGHSLFLLMIALVSTTGCSRPHAPAALASDGPGDPASAELAKLQGTWRVETSVWNSVRERPAAKSVTVVVRGDKLTWIDIDGITYQEDRIKLMPDQQPAAIDNWSKGEGPARPGIYSLQGDMFTWCSAGGNNKIRPTTFASEAGSRVSLMVLRRKEN